jgi:molybdopterin-synthase adenylyltransferase
VTGAGPADERFARQHLISGWQQEALSDATAVIIGMGALGNEVAKNLALSGVGRLVLCDPDTVERTNLSRTVLFRETDIGRLKVDAAARAITGLAPGTAVETRPLPLTAGVSLGELRTSSVVLGCLDSRRARLELLGRCALADAALVDGGTGPWSGEVRVRTAPEQPCYGCTLSARERAVADLPTAYTDLYPEGDLAASVSLTAVVGAWMSITAVRLLFGETPPYHGLRIEGLTGATRPVEFTRAADCPHHDPLGPTSLRVPVSAADTVGSLLSHLPSGHFVDTWTSFPVSATCPRCHTRTDYNHDPDRRQGERCVKCGALIRPANSFHLSDAHPRSILSDLGVAPGEILPMTGPGGKNELVELDGRP